jgi:subtilisin family serine protease
MKKYYLLFSLFAIFYTSAFYASAQDDMSITYMFRLLLTDKGQAAYTLDNPQQFLSQKSIDRRMKQKIQVNETDFPIAASCIEQITATGVDIVAQSKWVQTVTVKTTDSLLVDELLSLPFVDTLYLVYRKRLQTAEEQARPETPLVITSTTPYTNIYGEGLAQIAMHNGEILHEKGYRGEGMTIAVIDGGFYNADCIDAFDPNRIIGTRDFSYLQADPYRIRVSHGTQVLSCMLSNKNNVYVGTAPQADYYLFSSEVDVGSEESPVEEDFWISAIEYADSLGVDISTTSLGYNVFDLLEMNHTHAQLDGQSVLMSRAARMAAEKGILLLNAAGNEGNKDWQKITVPSDADKILTVGAIQLDRSPSPFTSQGPTVDGRTKPDVVALGTSTATINGNGSLSRSNGTSFATPVMAGLAACLWQAFPEWMNLELIACLHQISQKPGEDIRFGFGIPDISKAFEDNSTEIVVKDSGTNVLIRHIGKSLLIQLDEDRLPFCRLSIYDMLGNLVEVINPLPGTFVDISHLPGGLYVVHSEGPDICQTYKFILR